MAAFPNFRQMDLMDCGPTCLRMIAQFYGKTYSAQTLRQKTSINKEGVSMLGLAEAAEEIGLKTVGVKLTLDQLLSQTPLPCILHWGQNHFVVLYKTSESTSGLSKRFLAKINGGRSSKSLDAYEAGNPVQHHEMHSKAGSTFYVSDPAAGMVSFTEEEFRGKWLSSFEDGVKEGVALLLEPSARFYEEEGEEDQGLNHGLLVQYLSQYKKLIIQLILGMFVGSGAMLVLPFLTQSIVDVGIETQDLSFINLVLIAQIILLLSTSSIDFLRSWILLHISTRLNLTILSGFLSKLMRLPISFFDVKLFGDLMQRIGDHHRIEQFLTGQALNLLFSLFNVFLFGFVLAYYNLSIFLIATGASLLYVAWILLFLKRRRKLDTKRFEVSAQSQSQVVQLIQGIQEIKLSGSETSKKWEWERTQAKLFKWNTRSLSLSQTQQVGALLINNAKNIFITFLAAKAVIDGQLTLGAMMSILYILGQFSAPVEQLISFLQSWQDAQMSMERLNEVHTMADEEPQGHRMRTDWNKDQDISIENLSYTYPGAGNEPVLRNLTMLIPAGKVTAVVGSSGSGKTTLLKLLLRFYTPETGGIYLKTRADVEQSPDSQYWLDVRSLSHRAWRQGCGVVMQDGFIFSDSIALNIAMYDETIDEKRLYDAARTANIHNFIESLPLGYHTKIGTEGNGLSQGQKQRILIARSVYKDPTLLLFDEATNSLDANNEAVIVENLRNFFKGRTVVIVAHRLSTVRHADQIVVMEKGEIVEKGTHSELLALKKKYYQLVSNQLELITT